MRDYAMIHRLLLADLEGQRASPFFTSDMTLEQAFSLNMENSFFKKLSPTEGVSATASKNSLDKFLRINDRIADRFSPEIHSEVDSLLMDYWSSYFREVLDFDFSGDLDNFDLEFIRDNFKVGPGASIAAESRNFYTKVFDSELSSTSPWLFAFYRAAISESDLWAKAEMQRFNKFGNLIVEGNRLFFVPKNAEIGRTCCTEPLLNMMFQQALCAFLERRLFAYFRISLDTQPAFNRNLARIGSLFGTFGTIDSVSASDSISWSLMQQKIPSNLLGYFRIFRSETTVLPDGKKVTLKMISTMGNAFTFPLQTIIFACAVKAVYKLKGLTFSSPQDDYGVFGDDIVVKTDAYDSVVRLLSILGFEVNDTKSFNVGPFRESCGEDYFNGIDIRGVYITSLETDCDVYSAINRLNRWTARSKVPLSRTVCYLRSLLQRPFIIPFSGADHEGLKCPFNRTRPKVDSRYWFSFRKISIRASYDTVPENKKDSIKLGFRDYNLYGWATTVLGRYARGDDISYRDPDDPLFRHRVGECQVFRIPNRENPGSKRRIKVVRDSIPFWDWAGSEPLRGFTVKDWEVAYGANGL